MCDRVGEVKVWDGKGRLYCTLRPEYETLNSVCDFSVRHF